MKFIPAVILATTTATLLSCQESYAYSSYRSLKKSSLNIPSDQSSSLERRLPTITGKNKNNGISMVRRETIKMPSQTPMVPYKPPGSDYAQFVDIESAMYRDRTMMISRFIDEEAANSIISIILYLRKEDPKKPIDLYFNVPGAILRPALAVYDLLLQTRDQCEISTVNLGLCTGMGALLCGAGTKGKRSAMPNSRFLLQRTGMDQPFRGQATDIALEVKNVKQWNDRVENEFALITGQPLSKIQSDMKRDFYLSSEEAVRYGLIDQVLLPSQQKRAARGQVADLGAFEGEEEQRYQGEDNKGGFGSQQQLQQPPPDKKKDDDDDGPEILKG
mmetsp:Transcript_1938/g.2717  ORF Transcript_1938/g.2717 Transcript_1938/m.2717 type:complete len:332 (+) Transcript_1938:183-1178(+)